MTGALECRWGRPHIRYTVTLLISIHWWSYSSFSSHLLSPILFHNCFRLFLDTCDLPPLLCSHCLLWKEESSDRTVSSSLRVCLSTSLPPLFPLRQWFCPVPEDLALRSASASCAGSLSSPPLSVSSWLPPGLSHLMHHLFLAPGPCHSPPTFLLSVGSSSLLELSTFSSWAASQLQETHAASPVMVTEESSRHCCFFLRSSAAHCLHLPAPCVCSPGFLDRTLP